MSRVMNGVHGNVHANFETNTWLKPEDWNENNPRVRNQPLNDTYMHILRWMLIDML
jgi:hypothetical protein